MEPNLSRAQSPSQLPASSIKYHHPYFTPAEIEIMSEKQRGKMNITQEDKIRQNACGFIDAIGSRIGLWVSSHDLQVSSHVIQVPEEQSRRVKVSITVSIFSFREKTSISM